MTHVTLGKVVDRGIRDANNMGAAMAPAAFETLRCHFSDTGRAPSDYDLIVTGDLGALGRDLVAELFRREGQTLTNYDDCGLMLFDRWRQKVCCGASGCGCSAAVLCSLLLEGLMTGRWQRLLFCGTGALHSPAALGQGESIPGICHAVALEGPGEEKEERG